MNWVQRLRRVTYSRDAPTMDDENSPQPNTSSPSAVPSKPAEQEPAALGDSAVNPDVLLGAAEPIPEVVREKLMTYRHLIGIATHRSLIPTSQSMIGRRPGDRPAPNVGLYGRVVRNELKTKTSYKYFSVIINGCLGLQIIVAASLTAMGAAKSSNAAITAFGAINTIIAGFLTYLKGSGLPNRLKYYHNEWKKLREFIEQRERDLSRPAGANLDVYAIVTLIEQMYNDTKMDIEINNPDGYNSIANVKNPRDTVGDRGRLAAAAAKDHSPLDLVRSTSVLSHLKGLEAGVADKLHEVGHTRFDAADELEKGQKGLADNVGAGRTSLASDLERGRAAVAHDLDRGAADVAEEVARVRQQASGQLDTGRQGAVRALDAAESEVAGATGSAAHGFSERIRELRSTIDSRVHALASSIEQHTHDVAHDVESHGVEHEASRETQEASRALLEHARGKIEELAKRLSHHE